MLKKRSPATAKRSSNRRINDSTCPVIYNACSSNIRLHEFLRGLSAEVIKQAVVCKNRMVRKFIFCRAVNGPHRFFLTAVQTRPLPMLRDYSLNHHWMPFTANRAFKSTPRMVTSASGVYLYEEHGRKILDGSSGLFCVPAGHC